MNQPAPAKIAFAKPPLSIEAQLEKLKGRNLIVGDEKLAKSCLQKIGYYRLSAYTLPCQDCALPEKPFIKGTTFETVLQLYSFDRALRVLLIDALERIEVALRVVLNHEMCMNYGAHWYMEPAHFKAGFRHADLIQRIKDDLEIPEGHAEPLKKHNEVFINHYYQKYNDPSLPPAWMIAETLSLGTWSKIYSNIASSEIRQKVASLFANYNDEILGEWLHTLAYLRNLCAHHLRLWNRKFVIKARTPRIHGARIPAQSPDRFYAAAVIIFDFLQVADPNTQWNQKLEALITDHPAVKIADMGFTVLWKKDPFWKLGLHAPKAEFPAAN